jgi:4a-hydroxytetrahydrobiopterin dehydratase
MTKTLSTKTCTPCQGGIPPLSEKLATKYLTQADGWKLLENSTVIARDYTFDDFRGAMIFVGKVGELAETEGHHPDVEFGWGYAKVSLQTKKIKGLHENDFIMAAKINEFL